jgi:hypothetical protein
MWPVIITAVLWTQAPGEDVSAETARLQKELRTVIDDSVAWNEFLAGPNQDQPTTALMVHRWTNDARDPRGQGLVNLWLYQGRPVAAASIYPWDGRLIHELESLSRQPFAMRRNRSVAWKPETGIEFRPIPNAAAPAPEPAARLREMKQLADQFTAIMLGWKEDDSDRETLRRLPREFYRYRPETSELLDGAIFGYVLGTDPEVLLLIEAVLQNGEYEWQYAFVRLTSGGLEGRHLEQVVWTADKHVPRRDPTNTWFSLAGPLELGGKP